PAGERDVDGEVMPAKLNHPWLGFGGDARNRDVIFSPSEPNAICWRTRLGAGPLQRLVAVDDIHHLLVTRRTQAGSNQRERSLLLNRGHVAKLESITFGRPILECR